MLAKVLSGTTVGLKAIPITVEVDISKKSLPAFNIVGLPSKAVEESKERVRAALKNSGAEFPQYRITVNLAPADLPKEGPVYDLPIAVGILIASEQISPNKLTDILIYGELSLDGSVRHSKGILPLALLVREKKYKGFLVPEINSKEASVVDGIKVFPARSLIDIFHHATNRIPIKPLTHTPFSKISEEIISEFDFADIKGQEQAKRALIISASGSHNVSMTGVPGAGKTMLARSLPSILPDLTEKEALEVTKIYSVTGNIPDGLSIIKTRPFRSPPHHTTSRIGLIGGGTHPIPGEISLAHRGVLFLDEFPEFPRHVLESLRQPLEDGVVTISRAAGSVSYPAKFMCIVASNPCPCGYFGSEMKPCRCFPGQIERYRKKVSGPIIDRIDIHLHLPPVRVDKLTTQQSPSENSCQVKRKIQKARNIQTKRFENTPLVCNADMSSKGIRHFTHLSEDADQLLNRAVTTLHLSARSFYKMIKLAQTIADLEEKKTIETHHIAEALQYRPKDI